MEIQSELMQKKVHKGSSEWVAQLVRVSPEMPRLWGTYQNQSMNA